MDQAGGRRPAGAGPCGAGRSAQSARATVPSALEMRIVRHYVPCAEVPRGTVYAHLRVRMPAVRQGIRDHPEVQRPAADRVPVRREGAGHQAHLGRRLPTSRAPAGTRPISATRARRTETGRRTRAAIPPATRRPRATAPRIRRRRAASPSPRRRRTPEATPSRPPPPTDEALRGVPAGGAPRPHRRARSGAFTPRHAV